MRRGTSQLFKHQVDAVQAKGDLAAQVAEVQNKLKALQESNDDLKKRLASYENEIAGWRLALENIEANIAGIAEE